MKKTPGAVKNEKKTPSCAEQAQKGTVRNDEIMAGVTLTGNPKDLCRFPG